MGKMFIALLYLHNPVSYVCISLRENDFFLLFLSANYLWQYFMSSRFLQLILVLVLRSLKQLDFDGGEEFRRIGYVFCSRFVLWRDKDNFSFVELHPSVCVSLLYIA